MVMSRYEFLRQAHGIIKPRTYLEVGVQTGASLALAEDAEVAIGIDPEPMVAPMHRRLNQHLQPIRSTDFWGWAGNMVTYVVDFGYIDGSHLFEDALEDFIGLERRISPTGVIMFDDVLPYNEAIARRVQPPGDWTGDVWKVVEVLGAERPDIELTLVDVAPTGLLMVRNLFARSRVLANSYDKIVEDWRDIESVPSHILSREHAVSAEQALELLRKGTD